MGMESQNRERRRKLRDRLPKKLNRLMKLNSQNLKRPKFNSCSSVRVQLY